MLHILTLKCRLQLRILSLGITQATSQLAILVHKDVVVLGHGGICRLEFVNLLLACQELLLKPFHVHAKLAGLVLCLLAFAAGIVEESVQFLTDGDELVLDVIGQIGRNARRDADVLLDGDKSILHIGAFLEGLNDEKW